MKLQTSCSLHLVLSQPTEIPEAVGSLIGFLGDQGVQDEAYIDEFRRAATVAITEALERGCAGEGDRFVEVTLTLNSLEVQLEIVNPSNLQDWSSEGTVGVRSPDVKEAPVASTSPRMQEDPRHGMRVSILHKDLGKLTWCYEPGFQERLLNSMADEVCASYEMINALIGLGELLAGARDLDSFLRQALQRLCELTRAEAVYVRMNRPGGLELAGQAGRQPANLQRSIALDVAGIETSVFATGEEATIVDRAKIARTDPLSGRVEAAFVAPIFFKMQRCGVLVLIPGASQAFFTAAQLQVARVVGEYLGIVSELSELQRRREAEQRALRELEIAAEIQMALMPQDFRVNEHLDTFGTCKPALKAGGDYFDLVSLSSGATFAVVADVMGKGVSAALLANILRTNIRAHLDLAEDPGRLLTTINHIMAPDLAKLGMFITAAFAWISPDGSEIKVASAGHPPALLGSAGGSRSCLQSPSLPIGVLEDTQYETRLSTFDVGELLFLYTDGIPEACGPDGEFYDVDGIKRDLAKSPPASAQEVVQRVLDSVDYFSHHSSPTDDRTLLAIIRNN